MRKREMSRLLTMVSQMTSGQRRELMNRVSARQESVEVIERGLLSLPMCPHCRGWHVVRNGQAHGLQRFKCRGCNRTFNALTGTPLARLRHKDKWLGQAQALVQGLSVTQAAQELEVARSTAFGWRHRFLALPRAVKAQSLSGIAEADETYVLHTCKGQRLEVRRRQRKPRHRGGKAARRGLSKEQVAVLVARDRCGNTTDFILKAGDAIHIAAALEPVLAADAVLCTDGSGALAAAARYLRLEHHGLNLSAGQRVQGPWHIQNVNAYHSRLKQWMRRFNGVATSYLANYLGWFRALDRHGKTGLQAAQFLALAVGA